jgi:hypothetical protein
MGARRGVKLAGEISAALWIEGNLKFLSELLRIKGTASKVASTYIKRWNDALAIIGFHNDGLSGWILFNIHFAKTHAAFLQKGFRAAAIGAPGGAVDGDGFHTFVLQN